MSHIFISYSKKNKDYARKLADKLLELGFDIWIDDRIDYGEDWELAIFDAIDRCAAFLIIMTPDSYESKWVRREINYAEKRSKPPFPILLIGEEFPRLALTQYVDVRSGNLPPDDFYKRLATKAPRKVTRGMEIADAPPLAPYQIQSGDKTLPRVEDILPAPFEWLPIPSGKVTLEDASKSGGTPGGVFKIPAVTMAKYPITNWQFQVFIDAADGYHDAACWEYSEAALQWCEENPQPQETGFLGDEYPRTNISWYEAVAFCRWLSAKTGLYITLPTERQWQRAAIANTGWRYPWGDEFDSTKCNTRESSIKEMTPVTQYPQGASPYGVMDMSGGVWEWTLSDWETGAIKVENAARSRCVRGGSFMLDQNFARAAFRSTRESHHCDFNLGFRIVMLQPNNKLSIPVTGVIGG